MASINFTQFELRTETQLLTSDYLVGYKSDSSKEIKVQVSSILEKNGYLNDPAGAGNILDISTYQINDNNFNNLFDSVILKGDNNNLQGNFNIIKGNNCFIDGSNNVCFGDNNNLIGNYGTVFGDSCTLDNNYSYALGRTVQALGENSYALGGFCTAIHSGSWIWYGNDQSLATPVSTTREYQFVVKAPGGVFLSDKVGIGTDSIENALTVNGTISASEPIKLSTVTTAPSNTTVPVAWTDIFVNNVLYKLPLYQ